MKVAIECKSPLLQKSLENFLHGHLSSVHSCDLILTDEKIEGRSNVLRIGSDTEADIKKPFSKAQLFLKIEQFYKLKEDALEIISLTEAMDAEDEVLEIKTETPAPTAVKPSPSSGSLEQKIERLTQQYIKGVMSLVKEHYEK